MIAHHFRISNSTAIYLSLRRYPEITELVALLHIAWTFTKNNRGNDRNPTGKSIRDNLSHEANKLPASDRRNVLDGVELGFDQSHVSRAKALPTCNSGRSSNSLSWLCLRNTRLHFVVIGFGEQGAKWRVTIRYMIEENPERSVVLICNISPPSLTS